MRGGTSVACQMGTKRLSGIGLFTLHCPVAPIRLGNCVDVQTGVGGEFLVGSILSRRNIRLSFFRFESRTDVAYRVYCVWL